MAGNRQEGRKMQKTTEEIQDFCKEIFEEEQVLYHMRKGVLFLVLGSKELGDALTGEAKNLLRKVCWQQTAVTDLSDAEAFIEDTEDVLEQMERRRPGIQIQPVVLADMCASFWKTESTIEVLLSCLEEMRQDDFELLNPEFYGILERKVPCTKEAFLQIQKGWERYSMGWSRLYHLQRGRREREYTRLCRTILLQTLRNLSQSPHEWRTDRTKEYAWEAVGYYEQRFPELLIKGILLETYKRQLPDSREGISLKSRIKERCRVQIREKLEEIFENYYRGKLNEGSLVYLPRRLWEDESTPYFYQNQVQDFIRDVLEENYRKNTHAGSRDEVEWALEASIYSLPCVFRWTDMQDIFAELLEELCTDPPEAKQGIQDFDQALLEEARQQKHRILHKWLYRIREEYNNPLQKIVQKIQDEKKGICEEIILSGGEAGSRYFDLKTLWQNGIFKEEVLIGDSPSQVLGKLDTGKLRQVLGSSRLLSDSLEGAVEEVRRRADRELHFARANEQLITYEWLTGMENAAPSDRRIAVIQNPVFGIHNLQILYRRQWNSYKDLNAYIELEDA
ncbi:MAG: hypothetical protein Q4E89_06070 [Eubacteriales bacterium]|nr:hypothetical protein [Eubacteriales bacterium]